MKIRTLNVGSMTGRSMELVDMMERRGINILCMQEIRWKGEKAREIGNGYKLFYYGVVGKRNGVGIVLNGELKKSVLAVNRDSDQIMWMKVEICEVMVNLMCLCATGRM